MSSADEAVISIFRDMLISAGVKESVLDAVETEARRKATRPLKCSRCPDQETHKLLANGPVYDFARAHGEADEKVLAILAQEEDYCSHKYWDVAPGGRTYCRACKVETTGMEEMGS